MASYAHLLNKKELEFLNSFAEEYSCNNFKHGGEVLHNSVELKKSCSAKNNRRNDCLFNKKKSQKVLVSIETVLDNEIPTSEDDQ